MEPGDTIKASDITFLGIFMVKGIIFLLSGPTHQQYRTRSFVLDTGHMSPLVGVEGVLPDSERVFFVAGLEISNMQAPSKRATTKLVVLSQRYLLLTYNGSFSLFRSGIWKL